MFSMILACYSNGPQSQTIVVLINNNYQNQFVDVKCHMFMPLAAILLWRYIPPAFLNARGDYL